MSTKKKPKENDTKRCSHIFRSGSLHPSIKIGGGVSMGQCENECLPGFTVCHEHANRDSLVYQVEWLSKQNVEFSKQIAKLVIELAEVNLQLLACKKKKARVLNGKH